jgi:hypothetical protein
MIAGRATRIGEDEGHEGSASFIDGAGVRTPQNAGEFESVNWPPWKIGWRRKGIREVARDLARIPMVTSCDFANN